MTPLLGYAPDADPTTPGVLTDCSNLVPFEAGMKGAPVAVSVGYDALAAACRGAVSISKLDGTRRLLAGTSTKLYEPSGTSWTDRSRAASYSLGSDDRWSFIQYADATLAATPTAVLQRSTTGAFADISGAPTAKLIEAAQGFAIAFNTTTSTDEWYCSAYLDETNWSLSVANQCVKGRLIGGAGPITAARRFGDNVIAYKAGSMYVGSYVGAPEVWRWTQVSNDVGCVGQDAVVDTSIGHVFASRDGVYVFDGTVPRPLGTGVIRKWLMDDMAGLYQFKTQLLWDRTNNLVWIFYARGGGDGSVSSCAVYHVPTQRWGLANQTIQAVLPFTSPNFTYDGGSTVVTTYDSGPGLSFDSLYWVSGAVTPSVVNGSNVVATLSGVTASSNFTTGDFGDDEGYRLCRNLRVRYTQAPTTSTATGYTKDTAGVTVATGSSSAQADGRHNLRQTARWHRFKVDTTGDFEVTAVRPEFEARGTR